MKTTFTLLKSIKLLLIIALILSNLSFLYSQQYTEAFSTETAGSKSFSDNGNSFTITSNFSIDELGGYGHGGDDRYVGNGNDVLSTAGIIGSITNSSDDFYIHGFWVYPSEDANDPDNSGTVIFRGKLNGSTEYTVTLLSGDINTNLGSELGFTYMDFSSYNTTKIDELEVEVTGSLRYAAIDDFEYEIAPSASVPTLTTSSATSVMATSATLGGDVTSDGGDAVTEKGIVYSVTSTNSNPEIGGTGVTKDDNGSGTGTFSESIGSLSPNTQYSFQAYATNGEGTSYGGVETFTTTKQSQTITFNAISAVTYGDADFDPGATASSGLDVTYSSSNTNIATIVSGKIHIVAVGSCTIHADQAGNATYNAATRQSQTLTINKATPNVSEWPSAAGITYGDDLNTATLSGGSASVSGSFAYDSGATTPDAGTYSASVTFTPTDASNYNTVSGSIDVAVAKATPDVSAWPSAAGITYGDALSTATLTGGTASVSGTFTYDNGALTPDAGTYSASVTFTPIDATNHSSVSGSVDVTIAKATPDVSAWPSAAGITYGDDLNTATLSGGSASVSGSFAYDSGTTTPNAGTYSAAVTFTPTDASNYNTVSGSIDVAVAKATPDVSAWPSAAGITYGDDLNAATLSGGSASVSGSFAYDSGTTTPNAGTYSAAVTFTPTDASNYNTVSGSVDVAVAKATPNVSAWPSAAGITYGDDLNAATLSGGSASVSGSFAYDSGTTTPNAGTYSAGVTFTPTDASNYTTVSGSVDVTVAKATPDVSAWPSAAGITYGDDLNTATLSGGSASVSGSFAYDSGATIPNAGTYSAAVTFTPTDASNYTTVSGSVDVTVAKATPDVSAWPSAAGITYGDDLNTATLSGGSASVSGSFTYDSGTTTPNAGTYSASVTFTPADASNYTTVSGSVDVVVAKVTLLVVADDKTKKEGEVNPEFTFQITGFVGGDTVDDLSNKPEATCTATQSSPAGDYTISVSGGSDVNYDFSYQNGTLTIDVATLIQELRSNIVWFNQTSGILEIDESYMGYMLEVYSINGAKLINDRIKSTRVDISSLNKGMYLVKVNDVVIKIIKK